MGKAGAPGGVWMPQPKEAGPSIPGPNSKLVFTSQESTLVLDPLSSQSRFLPLCNSHKIATVRLDLKES